MRFAERPALFHRRQSMTTGLNGMKYMRSARSLFPKGFGGDLEHLARL